MVDPRPGDATEDTLAATMVTGQQPGRAASDEDPLEGGTSVDRYMVVGRIGAGGMGVVYMAFDPELGRRVALKLLRRSVGSGERARRRLLGEAQALARLSHPNVVTIYDVGEHEGQVFLAMEFVEGKTLRKWLGERTRSTEEILRVLVEAGRGLVAAHDKGIIHRDFKPDNVMVDEDDRPRVMDFGLARAGESMLSLSSASGSQEVELAADDLMLTRGKKTQGTPAYMAPEQHREQATDERTDQFSFCVTLYEALYGERPFAGDSLAALSWSITEGKRMPVPRGRPVSGRVLRAIVRGLATDSDDRWPSMRALLDELTHDPRPARRRWMAGGVVVGVAGSLGAWIQWTGARAETACRAEGEAIAEVWNDERRARVGEALRGTGVGYAQDSWDRASSLLDDYTAEWSQGRAEACRRAVIEQEWSNEDLRRSRACFDDRRAHVDALLDAFAQADAAMVMRVVNAFLQLAPLTDCTDEAWLARRPPVSDDPQRRREESRLSQQLHRARAAITTARYDEALELIESVREEAETLGSTPLRVDAAFARGWVLERQGEYDEALELLLEAFYLAGGSGYDPGALDAALHLAFVTGYQMAQHEEGLRWSRMAEMFITRLGLTDDPNVVQWLTNVGSIHQARGAYEEALEAQRRALAMAERLYGRDSPWLSKLWTNLANAEHGRGDDAAALEAQLRALEIHEASLGPEHPHVALSLLNVGVAQHGRGRTHHAVASFQRALAIQITALGPHHPEVAKTLNNLGAMLVSMDEAEQALEKFERALAIQRRALGEDHHDMAGSYNNLARVLSKLGRHEQALAAYESALRIRVETLGPDHPHVARVYSSMGRSYMGQGQPDQAVEAQRKALAIWEEAHGEIHPSVGTAAFNLGEALLEAGKADEALPVLRRSLQIREAVEVPPEKLGGVRFALARAMVESGGDVAEALALAKDAREELVEVEAASKEIDAWVATVEPR